MSDDDIPTLRRAWPIMCELIWLLQLRVAQMSPDAPNRWILSRFMRLAESLMRRWLVLNACVSGPWPCARLVPGRSDRAPVSAPPRGTAFQTPRFRFLEPDPALQAWAFHFFAENEPVGPWLDSLKQESSISGERGLPPFNPTSLQRRIAALSAVMNDPETHTIRMARWLARAKAQREVGPGPAHPMRVGWPPGASQRQRRLDPQRQELLGWLDTKARAAVERGPPPDLTVLKPHKFEIYAF